MISWAEIVLLILKIANAVLSEYHDQRQFQAGTDAAIAKEAAAILAKTKAMQKIKEEVHALTDEAVDAALRDLESK